MRFFVRTAVISLIVGCLLNIVIAWAFATWSSPGAAAMGFGGIDPLFMAKVRREFYERPGPDPGGNDPGTLFVTVAYESFGAQFADVAVEDKDIPLDAFRGPLPYIGVIRTGWPLLAMEGQWHRDASRSPNPPPPKWRWAIEIPGHWIKANRLMLPRMIPFRPMWPGFAINTLGWALLFALPFVARRALRFIRHCCLDCGYPIGVSPVCTECGKPVRRVPNAAQKEL